MIKNLLKKFKQEGADILDIGAESTSPVAGAITAKQEWERLEPVLTAIKAQQKNNGFHGRRNLSRKRRSNLPQYGRSMERF